MKTSLRVRLASEFTGTAFLLLIVVGSGIMGQNLSQGNEAIALLANAITTGLGLFVLITLLGPYSGAHFNPVVTLYEMFQQRLSVRDFAGFLGAQCLGSFAGVFIAHAIFELPLIQVSNHLRSGLSLGLSEVLATFGLLGTIHLSGRKNPETTPSLVAAYITSAYWFTSSTSFANPAVTLARAFTTSFAGIAPASVPGFLVAQMLGLGLACLVFRPRGRS